MKTIPPFIADQLTRPERVLLEKLGEGLTFRQVDEALGLEAGTSHRLRKQLFHKIGARTRHEATASVALIGQVKQADLNCLLASYRLTEREGQVVILMLHHPECSRRQIGEQLGIAENTVRALMNRINKKLGVKSRAGAVHEILAALTQEQQSTTQANKADGMYDY